MAGDLTTPEGITNTDGAEIDKLMTIGTGHLRTTTREWLENRTALVVFPKGEYGWFIYVEPEDNAEVPNDLLVAMRYAAEHDCAWLCVDCDGPAVDGLVLFEES